MAKPLAVVRRFPDRRENRMPPLGFVGPLRRSTDFEIVAKPAELPVTNGGQRALVIACIALATVCVGLVSWFIRRHFFT
jgi:hypothetical protein